MAQQPSPSIFDIALVNRFETSLKPAFEYLFIDVLLPQFNELRWLAKYKDEIFALLNLRIQSHYLLTTGASFAEYLSGIRRSPCQEPAALASVLRNLANRVNWRGSYSLESVLYQNPTALGLPKDAFFASLIGLVRV